MAALVLAGVVAAATSAAAQSDESGLSRAVQALAQTISPDRQLTTIDTQRLFAGIVNATIINNDGDPSKFGAQDCIDFTLTPRRDAHPVLPAPEHFVGPRSAAGAGRCPGTQGTFEEWARSDAVAPELLRILFPGSLGAAILGRTPSQLHAEQFLMTTALAGDEVPREGRESRGSRALAGGLAEFEWLDKRDRRDGDTGWAWQGLYGINRNLSVQGRFAQQREGFTSTATTVSVDYHPFIEIPGAITWRLGGTARGGVLYSRSDAIDLGSIEIGGGGWASGFKRIGRVAVAGASMLEGSSSWIPQGIIDDLDVRALAAAVTDRGILYDLTVGGTGSFDTSSKTRVMVKALDTMPLTLREQRGDAWLLSTALSYRIGLPTVNIGYKYTSSTFVRGQSLFFQGNFDW
jgi:hypothetical protein